MWQILQRSYEIWSPGQKLNVMAGAAAVSLSAQTNGRIAPAMWHAAAALAATVLSNQKRKQ